MSDIFSPGRTRPFVTDLDAAKVPEGTASIGAVAKKDADGVDAGVQVAANVDAGKPGGWSTTVLGEWFKKAGGSVGWFWTKKG